MCLFGKSNRLVPVQVLASLPNWYPSSHSQRKVPGWLLQTAWEPQIRGSSLHSSTSDKKNEGSLKLCNICLNLAAQRKEPDEIS